MPKNGALAAVEDSEVSGERDSAVLLLLFLLIVLLPIRLPENIVNGTSTTVGEYWIHLASRRIRCPKQSPIRRIRSRLPTEVTLTGFGVFENVVYLDHLREEDRAQDVPPGGRTEFFQRHHHRHRAEQRRSLTLRPGEGDASGGAARLKEKKGGREGEGEGEREEEGEREKEEEEREEEEGGDEQ